jgi:hypothetical protein
MDWLPHSISDGSIPIFVSGGGGGRVHTQKRGGVGPPATRKNGKSSLILRVLCTRKMSVLNEDRTSGMLPQRQHARQRRG